MTSILVKKVRSKNIHFSYSEITHDIIVSLDCIAFLIPWSVDEVLNEDKTGDGYLLGIKSYKKNIELFHVSKSSADFIFCKMEVSK